MQRLSLLSASALGLLVAFGAPAFAEIESGKATLDARLRFETVARCKDDRELPVEVSLQCVALEGEPSAAPTGLLRLTAPTSLWTRCSVEPRRCFGRTKPEKRLTTCSEATLRR